MALVYPIYLDTPMMTAFLASLQGGVIEEANIETRRGDAQDNSKKVGFSISASNLLANFFGVGAEAELTKKISESLESQFKSTVKYPNAALFIRLRDLLIKENLIKPIPSADHLQNISVGDLIEFSGLALANPIQQIRMALKQIMPILEPSQKVQWGELVQSMTKLRNAKIGEIIKIGEEEILIERTSQKDEIRKYLENQKELNTNTTFLFKAVEEVFESLMPEEKIETILFESTGFNVLCKIYPAFVREERVQDIHDAHWHCLGKVLGKINSDMTYDLLKTYPIGKIAGTIFPGIAKALQNESINIQINDPIVQGPGLTIATLAIFA